MTTTRPRWPLLLFAGIGATAIVANATLIPWGRDEHEVVAPARADGSVPVTAARPLLQTARVSGEKLSAVSMMLATSSSGAVRPSLTLRITDNHGALIARARRVRLRRGDQQTVIWFSFHSPVQLPSGRITLHVETADAGMRVATAPSDAYDGGDLLDPVTRTPTTKDLVWGFATPTPAAFPVRVGAAVAAGILLLLALSESIACTDRARWRWAILITGIGLPLGMIGVLAQPHAWGISDWDLYFTTHEMYRETILRHRQFPLWNPAVCGGTAALADPEFPVLGPGFLLELLLGVPLGLRTSLLAHLAVGGVGMVLLSRRLGLSPAGATVAAFGAFASSSVPLQFVEGHVQWFAVAWIPWVLMTWLRCYRDRRSALLPGIFLAVMLFEGGIYPLFYVVGGLLLIPLVCKHRWYALRCSLRSGLWAAFLSAAKLLPMLAWVRQYRDAAYATSTFTLGDLHHVFLGRYRHGAEVLAGQGGGWHEYGSYLGPVLLALVLVGMLGARRGRVPRALVAFGLFALLLSSLGPWLTPLFDAVNVIPRSNVSRLVLLVTISASLLAGIGLDRLTRLAPMPQLLRIALISAMALDLFTLSVPISTQAFRVPPLTLQSAAASPLLHTTETHSVRVDGTDYTRAYANRRAGFGSLSLCTPIAATSAVVDWREPQTSTGITVADADARATLGVWTPNRLEVRVTTPRTTTVTLQTNAAPGWHINGGTLPETSGLLKAPVPAGEHVLVFDYQPPGFLAGIMVGGGTIIAALWLRLRRRLGTRATLP
ncbi:MAG: hypothetical protein Q8R32_02140 [bacterium]|nr:hypothetical protein [bacterium]